MIRKQYLLLAIVVVSLASFAFFESGKEKSLSFEEWKTRFEMTFEKSEEEYRKFIFERNLEKINKHNVDLTQTYKMGVNQFTAFNDEQFKQRFLGQISLVQKKNQKVLELDDTPNIEIDWTTKGAVSKVKNQGSCGSCWAFAAVASCQSMALLEKKTVDLSQQQLVDCSSSYGNHGCNGGSRAQALKYIKDHGITTQSAYSYKGVTQSCRKEGGDFHINSITEVSGCSGLQNALSGRPITVAVDAGGWSHYASGVFSNCGKSINHAVLLVGVVNGAWKIKNSWGTAWGEKGFIRLASGDTCGICDTAGVYPH